MREQEGTGSLEGCELGKEEGGHRKRMLEAENTFKLYNYAQMVHSIFT